MAQCTAKSKQSGQRCKRYAVPGKTVCVMHGGKSPGGLASPNLKTGRHSKYLPKNLLGKYKEALADNDLLQLRDEVALIDARLAEVLGKIEAGADSNQTWEDLQKEFGSLVNAMESIPAISSKLGGNEDNQAKIENGWRKSRKFKREKLDEQKAAESLLASMTNLNALITAGADNREAWEDVQNLVEQRRKLVESERRWYLENQQMITAEKALILIAAIADVIRQNVQDEKTKRIIIENINRLALIEPER